MNHLIFLRTQLYQLKFEYGAEIAIYRSVVSDTDLKTGLKSISRTRYFVQRAVVLPIKFLTSTFYSSILLKAGREFAYGGFQDIEMKNVIIDGRDLPSGFEILPEDVIIYNHKKFEIMDIQKLEVDNGYFLTVKRLIGAPVNEIHEQVLFDNIRFLQLLSVG